MDEGGDVESMVAVVDDASVVEGAEGVEGVVEGELERSST